MKKSLLLLVFLLSIIYSEAQVGIGTNIPNSSAALEIKDSTKGILIPRMSMIKRNAIVNPAEGLMIYQIDNTKGYWYFDGNSWKNINSLDNGGGKHTLVLADLITDSQGLSKVANELGINTQEIKIWDCSLLTTIDLSMLSNCTDIFIMDNKVLQSINLSNLTFCEGGNLTIINSPNINSLNLNSLIDVIANPSDGDGFNIGETKLTTINLPALKSVYGGIDIYNNSLLTSVSMPSLTQAFTKGFRSFSFQNNSLLSTISAPNLSTVGAITIDQNNQLTSLAFPSLTSITDSSYFAVSSITNCPNLTSISFDNLVTFYNKSFSASGNKLPSSQINYILHKFASITPPLTGKTFNLNGQSPSAPPTGQGIIDKGILIANGNTVITD